VVSLCLSYPVTWLPASITVTLELATGQPQVSGNADHRKMLAPCHRVAEKLATPTLHHNDLGLRYDYTRFRRKIAEEFSTVE
jgi:hypothetical protein